MLVNLNPPTEIISNYDIKLTTYTLQQNMNYYFYIDQETNQLITDITQVITIMSFVAGQSLIAMNIFSYCSSSVFNSLISIDTIRFLRYFEINYPENVLSIFRADLPTAGLIPDIIIKEDLADYNLPLIFQDYRVSIYIFNNNGNMIIEAFFYWFIGIILLKIIHYFPNKKIKNFKEASDLFSSVFIWSYAITYFLSNYMTFTFFSFLAYRFPTSQTGTGIWNIVFSVFMGIIILLVIPFIFIKVLKMRPIMLLEILKWKKKQKI